MTNWKETTLGEVLKVDELTVDNGYPFDEIEYIDIASVEERQILQTQKLKLQDAPSRAKRIVRDNDILISTVRPNLKHYCFIKKATENLIASTGFAVITAKKADPSYLYYLLTTNEYTNYLTQIAEGHTSAYPSFNPEVIENSVFVMPPLPEQKAIAAVLSSLDDKIELLRRQNKTLESIAQTIFKEWFVKLKVKSEKLKVNSSTGLPEGWRMGKLGEEFEIIMGQSPDGASYNESGEGIIFFQGRTDFQERFPAPRLYTTEPKRIAEKFDVLVSVRAPVGDINVASDKCCIGRGLAAVKGKYKSYALYKIKSLEDAFNKFEDEGTVFGCIGKGSFANIETIIPDSETIKSFEMITSPIDTKVYNNHSQIQTLSKLRDALLPKLMKGEIKVRL